MRIKICGLTNDCDAELAAQLGAWAFGFIFYPKSRRYVEPKSVRAILDRVAQKGLRPERAVGVFVNESAQTIRDVVRDSGIDTVQLHGEESPDFARQFQDVKVWKAFRLQNEAQISALDTYEDCVEAFLFDAAVPGQYGGTGQLANWDLLAKVPRRKPMIVSGGLGPHNARDAWERFQPFALDLASGVEATVGIKDHQKLKQLFGQEGA